MTTLYVKRLLNFIPLAWKPGVAQVTYSYSCRLPALGLELLYNYLSLNLKSKVQNIPVVLLSFLIKI